MRGYQGEPKVKNDGTLGLGYWLSLLVLVLGLAYFGVLVASLASAGSPSVEPYQSLISIVTLLTAPCMILLWVVIHQVTPAGKREFSLGSLILIAIFATLTSINRYNALTTVSQAIAMGRTDELEWFLPYGRPSIMLAMEVLAWGFYYGLACLCLAPVFGKGGLERAIFWTLIASGGLSFAAILGHVLNNPLFTMLGAVAWGPGLILLMGLWMRWFKKGPRLDSVIG
jgi:hypothetical protein